MLGKFPLISYLKLINLLFLTLQSDSSGLAIILMG